MSLDHNLHELIARVALRDRAAFQSLYAATSAHLFSVSLRVLRNEGRADEVLQDAYVNIWQSAASYNAATASPMTWMINVVRNKAIDALRSGKTEALSTTSLDDQAMNVAAHAAGQPDELLSQSLVKGKIDQCMQRMSAAHRQALALAYYRGLVHTDIATLLNVPLGTAKGWVRRGLDQLRLCLEAAGVSAS
jgi:RNA polymerase sigma-70 factor, ECF subfamily